MAEGPGLRQTTKSPAAFRTISEVAAELDVPQHVLRFWETRFSQVRPMKRAGGRRYYRPEDVALLRRIRTLLYQDGYTIRGVQRLLRAGAPPEPAVTGTAGSADAGTGARLDAETRRQLEKLLEALTELRELLRAHRK
ncbi:MAG: MerR family transcriptional regulator [Kiloniellales bacterium]